MRDEPLGVGPRDHDRPDAFVGLGAGDQRGEVRGDLRSELAARPAMQPGDEHTSSLLDFDSETMILDRCSHAAGPFVEQR